uniref:Uncharacterized protein n=1 Tax=Pararge aegeria TaxID=116150 RepID=S4PTD5_9NEOP
MAASHLPSTSQKAAVAAESAQMLKRRKCSVICNDYVFAALGFETLGPWSSDTKNLSTSCPKNWSLCLVTQELAII